jgi:hypothetical protein
VGNARCSSCLNGEAPGAGVRALESAGMIEMQHRTRRVSCSAARAGEAIAARFAHPAEESLSGSTPEARADHETLTPVPGRM